MATNPSDPDRDRLLRLIHLLPEREIATVEAFLRERLEETDPLTRALADAPEDDEPLTAEDEAALEEAYADIAAGRVYPADEVWKRLGHAPSG